MHVFLHRHEQMPVEDGRMERIMKRIKRILAIAGVVLILGMYLVTFLSAIFVKSITGTMFLTSVIVTLMVPLLIYVFQIIYRMFGFQEPVEDINEKNRKGFEEAAQINKKQNTDEGKSED